MIKLPGTQNIDAKRYEDVCVRAISDLAKALAVVGRTGGNALQQPHDAYKEFCHTDTNMPPAWFGAHKIRKLVILICESRGFKVKFLPWKPGNVVALGGYVSWLTASFGKNELVITYDPDRIIGLYPPSASTSSAVVYAQDKTLSKVFLHECGHAALHLNVFLQRITPQLPNPTLDPEHEQDAWLYADVVWGLLTGDHSYATRNRSLPDEGFKLA